MMRSAIKKLGCSREEFYYYWRPDGYRYYCSIESEIDTILVLSGISTLKTADKFPYRPHYILVGVNEIINLSDGTLIIGAGLGSFVFFKSLIPSFITFTVIAIANWRRSNRIQFFTLH